MEKKIILDSRKEIKPLIKSNFSKNFYPDWVAQLVRVSS